MKKNRRLAMLLLSLAVAALLAANLPGQEPGRSAGDLPVRYEELTAADFVKAVAKSAAVSSS